MKTAVIHRSKLLLLAICLFIVLGIKGSASAYSFEEDFFESEPEVTEIVDTTRGIKYKGLTGEIRLSDDESEDEGDENEGGRVKRAPGFYSGIADVFLNIPYAEKLTPESVFEPPQKPKDDLMKTRNENETNFRRFGNYCPQDSGGEKGANNTREYYYRKFCYSHMDIDCLNLNVFAPELNKPPKEPYPVYVLLHGGKFSHGSACDFGRPGLVHNFVSKGIVVVTLNYRLGLYGFHKKDKNDGKGNRGLYDQIMALEWVKDHIKQFNGDPEKVTLGGFDSGACSAAMLTLNSLKIDSPHLFRSVILHAGTADVCRKRGVFDQNVQISATRADLSKDVDLHNTETAKYELGMQYDVPDDVFQTPLQMIETAAKLGTKDRRKVNVLMGLNYYEFVAFERALDKFDYNNQTEEAMLQFFTEHVSIKNVPLNSSEAKEKMKAGLADALGRYKGELDDQIVLNYMRMMMEYVFVHNFILLARNLTELGSRVYIYRFDISPDPHLFAGQEIEMLEKNNVVVPHGTDVRYAYLAQQYWEDLKNKTDKANIAKEKKIGEDFANEVLVPFIKNTYPTRYTNPFTEASDWDLTQFLKIYKKNDLYNSSMENLSALYQEKTFNVWEQFALFRETGIAPKPNSTSGPPTESTKPTQPTDVTSKVPVVTTAVPVHTTTTTPVGTSKSPVDSSTAPVSTPTVPVDSSTTPVDNSTVPDDSSTVPNDSSTPVDTSKKTTKTTKTTPSLPTTSGPTTKGGIVGGLVSGMFPLDPNPTAQNLNGVVGVVDENR